MRERLESTPSLLSMLAQSAALQPDAAACEFLHVPLDARPNVVSYRSLLDDAKASYSALRALGVEPGDGVAMMLPSIPEAVVALVGGSEAGVVFPLNMLLSAEALAAQLRLARVKVAIVLGPNPHFSAYERLEEAAAHVPSLKTIVAIRGDRAPEGSLSWESFLSIGRHHPAKPASSTIERPAALFHSGGTTGAPKLAELSAKNLIAGALMSAAAIGWRRDDRILLMLPMFHVGGAVDVALASIAVGATTLLPTLQGGRNPELIQKIWQVVEQTRATVLGLVPTSMAAVAETPVGNSDLEGLRAIATGSAPLPKVVAQRVEAMTGTPIARIYGMTETSGIITAQSADGTFRRSAVGMTAPLVELRVAGDASQSDELGEIFVRGPNVFTGYRAECGIVPAKEDGWLATGDLGRIGADGQLELCGRLKDVIIRGGHNVDPLMIEAAALTHPEVTQAAAVPLPDAYAGEVPVLYVTLRSGAKITPEAICAHVADKIAEVPAKPRMTFVIPELPLSPVGKIARFKLRQKAAQFAASEALKGLPVSKIDCSDIAAKELAIEWKNGTSEAEKDDAAQRLACLGLRVAQDGAGPPL